MDEFVCDWCHKPIKRNPSKNRDALKHFCCREHFTKYRRKNNYYKHIQEKESYQKVICLAKKRLEIRKKVC